MITNLVPVASIFLVTALQFDPGIVAQRLSDPQLPVRVTTANQLVSAIEGKPEILRDATIQERIIAALELENEFTQRNIERFVQKQPPLFNEGYGEHYAEVLGLADRVRRESSLAPSQRTRLLRALVLGSYNGDSPFAKDLASEGEDLVPYVLEAVRSPNGPTRWNGFDLTALLFARAEAGTLKRPLTAKARDALRSSARQGLQDPAPDVRRHAVSAVVATRDVDAIPLLRYMAEKDSDAKGEWSVRARAAEGMKRLQQAR